MKKFLDRVVPLSATAMAMFAWQHRDDLVDWGAFGVRAVTGFAEGRQEDVKAEDRLRAKLTTEKRTRDASGIGVSVRDGTARLSGVVDDDTRAYAVAFARRTQGVIAVDDQLEVIHRRPGLTD